MLLKKLPLDETTPVQYVCFHPIVASELLKGNTINDFTDEKYEPSCMAVEYEYEYGSILHEVCNALGWQGGTIHQVVEEINKLRKNNADTDE